MNVSSWSIRNPVPALLLFALLTVLGVGSFHRMGVQDFPDLDFPVVTVSASLEGAAPAQLETEVARKLEDAVASLQGIEHVVTTITDGSVTVAIEFSLDRAIADALEDVRDAIDRTLPQLPADMDPPTVTKDTVSGQPIVTFVVTSNSLDEEALSWWVDNTASKSLLAVPGVGKVERVGGVTREVLVELDQARIDALGVSAATIARQLAATHVEAAGGIGELGGRRQALRTVAKAGSATDLAAMEIALGDGRRIRLDQVATVRDTVAERSSIARFDGRQVVGFDVSRMKGASVVDVADAVRIATAQLAAAHPRLAIIEANDGAASARASFRGNMHLLVEGAILAVVVVWLFLRDWRATLISAVALPMSVIPTFLAMHLMGFTLNTITLLALSLVVGILVDDAIVEVENIVRHLRSGKKPYQAAMEAADEIGLAVIATTFTLVAVFLPTAFMPGIAGLFFRQFGWTAGIAVLMSLVVARLLTPMMAAYGLRALPAPPPSGRMMGGYLAAVAWCMGHRALTTIACVAMLIGSILLVPLLPSGFIPPDDGTQSQATIELAPGSTVAETDALAERARTVIADIPEVRHVFATVGVATSDGGPDDETAGSTRSAVLSIVLAPRGERQRSQTQIEADMRARLTVIPGARVTVGQGGNGEQLQLVLLGSDDLTLSQACHDAVAALRTLSGLGGISSSASLVQEEIQIRPDRSVAAAQGVTSDELVEAMRLATGGGYAASLPKINLPDRQVPIRVRLDAAVRGDLDALRRLKVASADGLVPLASVADLSLGSGPAQIDRRDRSRQVTITAELNGRSLGEVMEEVDRLPALTNLPSGVTRSEAGDAERMTELFSAFGMAMAIGVFCIYAVLVLLFRDFLQPTTILSALPLAVGGAVVALLVTGSSFSMPSIIGLLMLMGIVTKNSILLVDYAVMARQHGMSRHDALIDACRKRARPIIMTTLAMGLGMLPVALGIGQDDSFMGPMAITVIGGLLTSTVLSLLVVPVAFLWVDDAVQVMRRCCGFSP
ncbi:MAG: efflux RND transporter permease subunit [Planctomycetes bacterium]|nr:efflux RND transporter permease subunit [Planctomycetota bacterium]